MVQTPLLLLPHPAHFLIQFCSACHLPAYICVLCVPRARTQRRRHLPPSGRWMIHFAFSATHILYLLWFGSYSPRSSLMRYYVVGGWTNVAGPRGGLRAHATLRCRPGANMRALHATPVSELARAHAFAPPAVSLPALDPDCLPRARTGGA